ncbi:MAG: aldo/keto reductase [Planctomycetota bacterium]|jgi:aryl-alcohol dehydrogenase-like predicted oxidoreductase|nr:aldo/keto reductase [Planctomycetota bacterium]
MNTLPVIGSPRPASRIALGTMIVNRNERERSFALLDAALAAGITTLDCAHGYAGGESERCIGDWLTDRGCRDAVTILTKGCHPNADRKRVTPDDIGSDLRDSLARLKTDQVDIWLLHRDDTSVPVDEIVDCLARHHAAGRIGAYGGSNWTHQRIAEANAYAASKGLPAFTASSPNFSLAEQVNDPWGPGCVGIGGPQQAEARAWYAEQDIRIFCYSSLARGLFSGRITRDNFSDVADGACATAYCHEVNFRRLDRAQALADARGLSVAQVAMAWVLNHSLDVVACCGAANAEEIAGVVAAAEAKFDQVTMDWLDLVSDAAPADVATLAH